MAEASDPQRGDGVRRRWDPALVAAVAGPALVLAVAAWLRRWTTDDAFINYRIVDHLLAGHGPVFNAGERVEAYTSALWLGLLALGQALTPLRIEHVAIAWSIPLSAGGLVAMALGSRRLLQPAATEADADDDGDSAPRIWWLPAGTLVLVALAPVWDFATAGLETGLEDSRDAVLDIVCELLATSSEDLDPVVGHRIV